MPLIYFVTLSRSDYTSLHPVALGALADKDLDAKIIAGGSHCLLQFGHTITQVEKEFPIYAKAEFLTETDDSPADLAKAYARAVTVFVEIFTQGKPDYVFVVGDRWEMLAVVSAASMLHIPIVHHSGGDITQGSADNQIRYALTCLAHLHLVALPEHRERLLKMGEEDWRVTTTGEPALTALVTYAASVPDIRSKLGLKAAEPFVLATFHPTSFDTLPTEQQVDVFLNALDAVHEAIILTAPNPDAASNVFLQKFKSYAERHPRVHLHHSLGTAVYYAAMNAAKFMIGNSSSGLWEAPSFGLPVINIGSRQQGRVHSDNVLNVPLKLPEIIAAIQRVSDPAFRQNLSNENPYVRSDTLELILNCLKQPYNRDRLLAKRFVDPLHA